ncbi:hypothetical protein COE14_20080 [Bacillus thuringiensis]|uniref:hypothetical protein n=1 Tax=Bacillus TaxID=1386 RepID=UPI00089F44F0|nr:MULTISPECIES: hypothetical protein [Bacillus]PGW54403.1 hypothetical protein COE14_20080 [Bacillus thuringiensis]SEG07791.1 hypothetical protein SAMN04487919_10556 [Bacillus sp. ok061]
MSITIEVIDNKIERDKLVERVEVLDKVKQLSLLPELEMATSKQVSEFYGVPIKSVNNILLRNRDELLADGYEQVNGKDLALLKMKSTKKENKRGYILINNEIKIPYNEVGLFPKRAILRVGMLLRDSEVAKEVRTQLLNIEESATQSYLNGFVLYGLSFSLLLMRPLTLYTKKKSYSFVSKPS